MISRRSLCLITLVAVGTLQTVTSAFQCTSLVADSTIREGRVSLIPVVCMADNSDDDGVRTGMM